LGPRSPVEVGLPDALAQAVAMQGTVIPTPQVGWSLIDTGASNTCIDVGVATALGLPIINRVTVQTPAGPTQQNVFAAKLSFPGADLPVLSFIEACGAELINQGIVALIGRDFLENKTLIYDGNLSTVTIAW